MYGKKVALIEASPHLGGTCVNVGKRFPLLVIYRRVYDPR